MPNRFHKPAVLLLTALALCVPSLAVPPARVVTRPVPKVPIIDYKLENGLRVILSPDKVAPVVSLTVMYNVGSRNEKPGKTGFAHLFEHLMFGGSENVGKGEHFALLSENGGSYNGTTSQERTVYYETVPANQMNLALFLEADRMRAVDLTQDSLDREIAVVKEERRQRVDNEAYGSLYEHSLRQYFRTFAYQHSTIGSMEDIGNAKLEDAMSFYKTYYRPNNAVLVLVGDFKVEDAKRSIRKYFGPIPGGPPIPPIDGIEPDRQESGERFVYTDPLAKMPRVRRYYRGVRGDHPDFYALQVLATALSGRGKTGRLYEPLVESRLALGVSAVALEMQTNSPFQIEVGLPATGDPAKVEETLDREIARIQTDGITESELSRAKTQLRTSWAAHLQTTGAKASYLATYTTYYNDPDRINTLFSRQNAVTLDDVKRVANTYLEKENSVTIVVNPGLADAPANNNGNTGHSPEEAQ